MDAGETDGGSRAPERAGRLLGRRVAPGQVWIACALCRRPVELSDSVQTHDGRVCPHCSVAS